MKKLISFFFVMQMAMHLFAQGDISKARWLQEGVSIDGKDNDWAKPFNFYDDKTGFLYAIGNDRTNLYFCLTTGNMQKMKKIINAGWKLELSSKEKRKKFKTEIDVPGVNMSGLNSMVAAGNVMKIYASNVSELTTKGFKSNKSEIKLNDRSDIDMAIGSDSSQHVVYEIAIPLQEFYDQGKVNYNEEITLDIKVNAMDRPTTPGDLSGMTGRMGGGEGRGMGGGMRGGRGMGGGMGGHGGMGGGRSGGGMSHGNYGGSKGSMGSMFESASFKQRFTLSGNL